MVRSRGRSIGPLAGWSCCPPIDGHAVSRVGAAALQHTGLVQVQARLGIGSVVAFSMAIGLIAAAVLVAVPLSFVPAEESALTGVVLLAFALGWALLAVVSVRFTDQPQRWAAAPAVFMGLAGLACLSGSAAVHAALSWVWPPALLAVVVWSFLRARRQVRSRGPRWLLYPVLAVLAVAAVGGGYQTVREFLDAREYPPPGQLIHVGGHRLHLQCTGSGTPTVVLEPGAGMASLNLAWIAPTVAQDSRVCVYDRPGRGWSDTATGPQDGAQIAAELSTLLDRAQVPGPYVLAGHSFGGLYVQTFAARHPDQVAGLVLLDSTAPEPGPAPPTETGSDSAVGRVAAVLPAMAHLGALRPLDLSSDTLPPRSRDEARANSSTARYLHSYFQEYLAGSASVRQAASLTSLDGKPLIVLSADTGHDAHWQAEQENLTRLSTNSLHRVARGTHQSLIDDEADSAAASRAIRDVIMAVRTSRPLA